MNPTNIALAIYGLEAELERELKFRKISFTKHDRLYFLNTDYRPLFAQVTWLGCQALSITSINDGIKKLRALGKNWALYSVGNHRRANLIQAGLARIKQEPIPFLATVPLHAMGSWTLLDANTIICSQKTTSLYPLGKVEFIEDKQMPPSRAYLKLWEFFTLHCPPPAPHTKVIDLGSSPGGWSWVLSQLKLDVISVDKAPLAPKIANIPTITFLQESAFGLEPKKLEGIEWLFCDIICYPERLLSLVKKWMQEGSVKNFACTIKFQDEVDFALLDEFLKIPGSKIMHLYHNKHEVMWWKTEPFNELIDNR